MMQDERWLAKFNEVKDFIVKNKRNPLRHNLEDHLLLNWIKHNRKLMNAGTLKPERVELFNELLALMKKCRRLNQWA